MSVMSDNYKRIMTEIEEKISNPEDLEFVKEKFAELSTMFIEIIDNLTEKTDAKINELEQRQQYIEDRISEVQGEVNEIEDDIYIEDEEDSEYEFEIVCPYCNIEFVAEIDGKNEVECPECHNMIELDWNDEEEDSLDITNGCTGSCGSCSDCKSGFEKNNENNEEENEDDM